MNARGDNYLLLFIMENFKFSIAQGTGATQKEEVPTYICKSEKWYRELMKRTELLVAKIEVEPIKEKRNQLKKWLPIKIPHAWMNNGERRLTENAHANSTVMCDYDDFDFDPREFWEKNKDKFLELNPFEVEISASGRGIHAWFMIPEGLTLKEAIRFYARRFGLVGNDDRSCCDLARAIYFCPEKNTLYRDWDAMFGDKELKAPVPTQEEISEIRAEMGLPTKEKAESGLVLPMKTGKIYPTDHQGIPFSDILKGLLSKNPGLNLNEKGEPMEGCRHSAEVFCAQQLKTLTDSNPEWLSQIIPNWEGDEKQWWSAMLSAKKYDVKYESSNLLKEVLTEIRQKKQEEEGATD